MLPIGDHTAVDPEKKPDPAEQQKANENQQHNNTDNTSSTFQAAYGDSHADVGSAPPPVEAYPSEHEAMMEATGLGTVPAPAAAGYDARAAETLAQRGSGVSRGQEVTYTGANGQQMYGGQYTNQDGTFFKTTNGQTYNVTMGDGGYTLQSQSGGDALQMSRLNLVSDSFSSVWSGAGSNGGAGGDTAQLQNASSSSSATATLTRDSTTAATATEGGLTSTTAAGLASSSAAPMDGATFYNQYKNATTPQEQGNLASYLNSLTPGDRSTLFGQLGQAAKDDPGAQQVLGNLRETLRSNLSNESTAGSTSATAGSDSAAAQGHQNGAGGHNADAPPPPAGAAATVPGSSGTLESTAPSASASSSAAASGEASLGAKPKPTVAPPTDGVVSTTQKVVPGASPPAGSLAAGSDGAVSTTQKAVPGASPPAGLAAAGSEGAVSTTQKAVPGASPPAGSVAAGSDGAISTTQKAAPGASPLAGTIAAGSDGAVSTTQKAVPGASPPAGSIAAGSDSSAGSSALKGQPLPGAAAPGEGLPASKSSPGAPSSAAAAGSESGALSPAPRGANSGLPGQAAASGASDTTTIKATPGSSPVAGQQPEGASLSRQQNSPSAGVSSEAPAGGPGRANQGGVTGGPSEVSSQPKVGAVQPEGPNIGQPGQPGQSGRGAPGAASEANLGTPVQAGTPIQPGAPLQPGNPRGAAVGGDQSAGGSPKGLTPGGANEVQTGTPVAGQPGLAKIGGAPGAAGPGGPGGHGAGEGAAMANGGGGGGVIAGGANFNPGEKGAIAPGGAQTLQRGDAQSIAAAAQGLPRPGGDAPAIPNAPLLLQNMIPGLDLNQQQNRTFVVGALQQLSAAKLGHFDPTGQAMRNALTGMDPARITALQNFLAKAVDANGTVQINESSVSKMQGLLAALLPKEGTALSGMEKGPARGGLEGGGLENTALRGGLPPGFLESLRAMQNATAPNMQALLGIRSVAMAMNEVNRTTATTTTTEVRPAVQLNEILSRSVKEFTPVLEREGRKDVRSEAPESKERRETIEPRENAENFSARLTPTQLQTIMSRLDAIRNEAQLAIVNKGLHPAGRPGMQQPEPFVSERAPSETSSDTTRRIAERLLGDKDKPDPVEPHRTRKPEEADEKIDPRLLQDAAMLTALTDKKPDTEKDVDSKVQVGKADQDNKRRRYIVKERDTLESIAVSQLKDKRLAQLIQDINKALIPIQEVDGKSVPVLKPRLVIWLPSPSEVKTAQTKLAIAEPNDAKKIDADAELKNRFGENWAGDIEDSTRPASIREEEQAATQTRRSNIENVLGPIAAPADDTHPRQVARLGDTLKSIAMKHPSLQDVHLWKLIAELNNLSTEVDAKGTPVVKLSRGMSLAIPTDDEVVAYRAKHNLSAPGAGKTMECPGCHDKVAISAVVCVGCGHAFKLGTGRLFRDGSADQHAVTGVDVVAETTHAVTAANVEKVSAGPVAGDGLKGLEGTDVDLVAKIAHSAESELAPHAKRGYPDGAEPQFEQLSDNVRIAQFENLLERPAKIIQVEIALNNVWTPTIIYEIYPEQSKRHEVLPDGAMQTVLLELNSTVSTQFATNDVHSNWKNYRDRYIALTSLAR